MSFNELISSTISFLFYIIPIVIPLVLIYFLIKIWIDYVRTRFISSQEHVLLRIFPPKDIYKTPLAMELFMNALYQTGGEGTPIKKYWQGSVRAWFSLEIVSIDGEVGFYIWTRKSLAGYIESQIYAQYPGIEVNEVEDYASKIDFESGNYSMFGAELKFTEPDPVPIKTYVDYGLNDASVKEEFKVDPMSSTLEYLGSLKQGENMWIQIIVRAHKKEDKDPAKWFGKVDNWQEKAKELIIDIRKASVYKDPDSENPINLSTKGQQEKIAAIERSISKLGFDAGIRLMYIAEKDVFNPVNIGAMMGSFKQFGSTNLNGFKPGVVTDFDYWWQDPFGTKLKSLKQNIFSAYIERDYFWKKLPKGKPRLKLILNSEELATLYHFPGSVSQTPSLTRIQSRKGEPPANLPM